MFINRRMDEETVLYSQHEIVLSNKKGMTYCYGLNVFPPNSSLEALIPNVMVLDSGALGR